ncbi:MAG: GLPGLI family protein [Muribaculaceae bacterium]|nr:GLPGLI family protein [Muribaculaceae bacterium]
MKTIFRHIAVMAICSLCAMPAVAQRKDTDAKNAESNFARVRERRTVGNAHTRIRYAFNALDLADKQIWIDEGQLKIAQGMTDYSSHFVEVNEDSLMHWFDTHTNFNVYPPRRWLQGYKPDHWIEYQYSQIVTRGNRLEEWATMPRALSGQNLYYVEPLPLMNWEIGTGTKTVCGYECIEAKCHWRGRDYTAWFAPEIPAPYGPWKFGGLPGVIMEIYDSGREYTFEAVAVETGDFPVYAPRGDKYKESSRAKVWKLQHDLNVDYFKTADVSVVVYKTGQVLSSRKHPYSQLELE